MRVFLAILVAVVVVQALTDEQKEKIEKLSKECLEVSKVEDAVLKEAEKGNYLDDPKLKIHAFCFSKKLEVQNEKGDFQEEIVRKKLSGQMKEKEEIEKIIKLCLVKKETSEQTAFEALKCLKKNLPDEAALV